jgi:hypothetical protein
MYIPSFRVIFQEKMTVIVRDKALAELQAIAVYSKRLALTCT